MWSRKALPRIPRIQTPSPISVHPQWPVLSPISRRSSNAASWVLDAGCGPGRDLARFAAQGHRGIGIDLNRDFVDRARTRGPAIVGDLRDLPFRVAAFDAVWASASLIHLPHEDAGVALREIARVASVGAPVSVSVKSDGVTGWADDLPLGRRWFSIWHPGDFARAVEDAGMSVEAVVSVGAWTEVRARR